MSVKTKILAAAFAGVFFLVAAGCSASSKGDSDQPDVEVIPPVQNTGFDILVDAQVVPVNSAVLSFSSPGVIEAVFVSEGEAVEKGDVIARLEGRARLEAAVATAELEWISATQAQDLLYENAELVRANAELVLAQAEIALEDAQEDREDLDYRRASDNTLDEIRANYILAEDAVDQAEDLYSWVEDSPEDDPNRAYALTQLAQARKNRDRALANLNYAMSLPDPEEVTEADALLSVAEARVADAKRQLEDLQEGPDPDDVELAVARVRNAELQLASARSALSDLDLEAPFNGVVATNNLTVGEYISPGMPAVELGDLSAWEIETTDLTELDVVGINIDDPVLVSFDAISDLELEGHVSRVSQRGVNAQGDVYYVVTVQLDEQDDRLLWGMTASVQFLFGE